MREKERGRERERERERERGWRDRRDLRGGGENGEMMYETKRLMYIEQR